MKKVDPNSQYAIASIGCARKMQVEAMKTQNALLKSNELHSETLYELSGKQFEAGVVKLVCEQLENSRQIDIAMQIAEVKKNLPYEIRFNKNTMILEHVYDLITTDSTAIMKLARGNLPAGYDNTVVPGVMPYTSSGEFWGSSKSTILSASLAIVNMQLTKEAGLFPVFAALEEVDTNASFYSYPITDNFAVQGLAKFAGVSIFHTSGLESIDFGTAHSGYAFGGNRYLSPDIKLKPYDCSSLIESIYGLNRLVPQPTATTADLYFTHLSEINRKFDIQNTESILNWQSSPSGVLCKQIYTVQPEHVVPGNIFLINKFPSGYSQETSFGRGGHTGIIIDTDFDVHTILEVNRDMPHLEGFGLSRKCARSEEIESTLHKVTVLGYEGEHSYPEYVDIPFSGMEDLHSIVDHFDRELLGNNDDF